MPRSSLHVKISSLLLHLWTTSPPSFVLSLTCPVWWGVGFSIGDRNRQVFRCVMFDMLTQHAFITGRRQVWQQRLPGHDYIISWCAAEGQGRAPQSKTKHLWDSGSRRLKSLKKCSGFVFTVHCTPSCLDILHLLVLGGNFSERWPICDIHK